MLNMQVHSKMMIVDDEVIPLPLQLIQRTSATLTTLSTLSHPRLYIIYVNIVWYL